ncbi:hypothetical protein, partial [Pseudomonas syringae group genomosp. 7]|uniref:hypothetical protein n=1 Tax=Pseudomonas syringae group genomosp. 7 TaxID=251699 RepID=UPI0037702B43
WGFWFVVCGGLVGFVVVDGGEGWSGFVFGVCVCFFCFGVCLCVCVVGGRCVLGCSVGVGPERLGWVSVAR